ncbi:MAG: lipid II:glycine glycyltransferase FemX [Gammaproteobacteria bacterium]
MTLAADAAAPAPRPLSVAFAADVEPVDWDARVARCGGGFFQCHAYARFEARRGARPLYIAIDAPGAGEVGVAAAVLARPRWWPFSRWCATATLGSLPALRAGSGVDAVVALRAVESALARIGVLRIRIAGFDCPHSAAVLAQLGYAPGARSEFYVDLEAPLAEVEARFKGARRTDIRKAEKLGVCTGVETGIESWDLLDRFERESLGRRGVAIDADGESAARACHRLLEPAGRALLFVSRIGGEPVNAAAFAVFGRRAYYLYSGSSAAGNRAAGPAHLLWTAMREFKERDIGVLNLGGVKDPADDDDPNTGLFRFKRNFGAEVVAQPGGVRELPGPGAVLDALMRSTRRALRA